MRIKIIIKLFLKLIIYLESSFLHSIMSKTKLRIVQHFVDFNENKPKGIYIHINKGDIF